VRHIDGLSVCYFVDDDGTDRAIIGWYGSALEEQKRLEAELAERRAAAEKARIEAENRPWVEALNATHFEYLQRGGLFNVPRRLYMHDLVGSYMVKCPVIEDGWGGAAGNMTLEIVDTPRNKYGIIAAMDLVLVKGTMLIAQTKQELDYLETWMEGYTTETEKLHQRQAEWRVKYRNIHRAPGEEPKKHMVLTTPSPRASPWPACICTGSGGRSARPTSRWTPRARTWGISTST
jgi:hypothetical protein